MEVGGVNIEKKGAMMIGCVPTQLGRSPGNLFWSKHHIIPGYLGISQIGGNFFGPTWSWPQGLHQEHPWQHCKADQDLLFDCGAPCSSWRTYSGYPGRGKLKHFNQNHSDLQSRVNKKSFANITRSFYESLKTQCEEVARIYTGMPVYTGILAKSPAFRPYFCDFTRIFVILCRLNV